MKRSLFIAVSILVMLCGCGKGPDTLLARLPVGSDVYVSVDPVQLSLDEVLQKLEAFPQVQFGAAAMETVLGFSPLRWSSWEDHLGLRADGRVALIVRMEQDEPELVCLVLPTSDTGALESLLEKVPQSEASFWVSQWDQDYVMLAAAEERSAISDFSSTVEGDRLDSQETLSLLRGDMEDGEPAVEIYALPQEQDVDAVYLSVSAEGSRLSGRLSAIPRGPGYEQFGASVFSSGSAGTAMRFPGDLAVMGRLSLDAGKLAEMAAEQMPPDANAGLAFLGFSSIEEFMSAFNGDIFLGMADDVVSPRMVGGIGVADEEAVAGILSRLQGIMAMSGEQSVESFTFEGRPAFAMEAPVQGGSQRVEVGLGYGALYVVIGYDLGDVSGWQEYDAIAAGLGAGSPGSGSGHMVLDLQSGMELLQSQAGVDLGDVPDMGWASMRLTTEQRMIVIEADLDTGASKPFLAMAELLLAVGRQLQPYPGPEQTGITEIPSPSVAEPQPVEQPESLPPPPPPGEPEPLRVETQ